MKKLNKKIKRKIKAKTSTLMIIMILLLGIVCAVFCVLFITKKLKINNQMQFSNSEQNAILTNQFKDFENYKFTYKYVLKVSRKVNHLDFILPIPQSQINVQYLNNLKLTPKPEKIYKQNGNLIAKFSFDDISNQNINIVLKGNAHLKTYNIKRAKEYGQNNNKEEDLTPFLQPEKFIESDDEYIKSVADGITGSSEEEILQNMYEYIQNHMKYQLIAQNLGAKKALETGYGKCSEYAAIMVALCRAKGIPARIAFGNIARDVNTKHAWVEVYFNEYGWVTYDPTIQATKIDVYDANGKLLKTEQRYDVSHDNVNYIKSGIILFTPYLMKYSSTSPQTGNVSIIENIRIKK